MHFITVQFTNKVTSNNPETRGIVYYKTHVREMNPDLNFDHPEKGWKQVIDSILDPGSFFQYFWDRRPEPMAQVAPLTQGYLLALSKASGRQDITTFLLNKGLEIDAEDAYGRTILMWAACANNHLMLAATIAMGAKAEYADKKGHTALVYAIHAKDVGAVRMLLKANNTAEFADRSGLYPLAHAYNVGDKEILEVFSECITPIGMMQQPLHCSHNIDVILRRGYGLFERPAGPPVLPILLAFEQSPEDFSRCLARPGLHKINTPDGRLWVGNVTSRLNHPEKERFYIARPPACYSFLQGLMRKRGWRVVDGEVRALHTSVAGAPDDGHSHPERGSSGRATRHPFEGFPLGPLEYYSGTDVLGYKIPALDETSMGVDDGAQQGKGSEQTCEHKGPPEIPCICAVRKAFETSKDRLDSKALIDAIDAAIEAGDASEMQKLEGVYRARFKKPPAIRLLGQEFTIVLQGVYWAVDQDEEGTHVQYLYGTAQQILDAVRSIRE